MDVVYVQPLKELLQVSTYFKEPLVVLVTNEKDEKVAKTNELIPCYLVLESTPESDLQKLSSKKRAVLGGSVKSNELAVRLKADYLLQPSNTKQFFDLGLAQKLADNGTVVVLMFEELLKANSFERHQMWKNYVELVRYCKLKKTKLGNDLGKDLNDSYKDIPLGSLKTIDLSDQNKLEVTRYINISNIIGIQIRAEQLYDNKKEDGKVNVSLKKYWETIIQQVKGQYEKYMTVDAVDPFKLRNDLEKVRGGDDNYKYQKNSSPDMKDDPTKSPDGKNAIFSSLLTDNKTPELFCSKFNDQFKNKFGKMILINITYNKISYSCIARGGNFGD
ncbi:MAG: hypothetical protein WCK10_03680, partial [Candidatus Staskawiczbacteria bacterium]